MVKYILLEVDLGKFDNIINILNEISDYYNLYRAEEEIKIHINNYSKEINVDSKENDVDLLRKLNKMIKNSELLKKNVTLYVDLRVNEYDILYAHAKKIIIPHNVDNMVFKMAKAAIYSKRVILDDLPLYKEFEKNIGYNFEYKRFASNKKAIIEALTDVSEFYPLKVDIPSYSAEEISGVWRMLL